MKRKKETGGFYDIAIQRVSGSGRRKKGEVPAPSLSVFLLSFSFIKQKKKGRQLGYVGGQTKHKRKEKMFRGDSDSVFSHPDHKPQLPERSPLYLSRKMTSQK